MIFYGGEPLLRKDLIKQTIEYIKTKKCKTKFYFGITTNLTLIDDDFIEFMKDNKFINVSCSIDGTKLSHDLNRKTISGDGSFDIACKNAKKILKAFDNAIAMLVLTRNNISNLSNNVEFLINMGFKYFNLQLDYTQSWKDEDLDNIKKRYNDVAKLYENNILQENDIKIIQIDEKIRSYIDDKYDCNSNCQFGAKTINVATNGNFYPCMEFTNNSDFVIGNCKDGVDINARANLIKNLNKENKVCINCAIRKRCKHTCACRNYILTNDVCELSPFICESEKIIVHASDKMAEKLYKQNSKLFIQKYYNKGFNILNQIVNKYEKG